MCRSPRRRCIATRSFFVLKCLETFPDGLSAESTVGLFGKLPVSDPTSRRGFRVWGFGVFKGLGLFSVYIRVSYVPKLLSGQGLSPQYPEALHP